MGITVAIAAPGNMGAAVGARLTRGGSKVLTSLQGRGPDSVTRAWAGGMTAVSDNDLVDADFILSILPPNQALAFATRLAPALQSVQRKPVYIDCNAISPETAALIERVIASTGTHFLDGSIIGLPPKPQDDGPVFYVSGACANLAVPLEGAGLVVKQLDGGIGSASALKMCYGGITKGLVALASVMALASERYEVGQALRSELGASQPQLVRWLTKMVPDMFPKAYRWVGEMDEISAFLGDRPEAEMFHGIARVYENMAADWTGRRSETDVLAAMFNADGLSA